MNRQSIEIRIVCADAVLDSENIRALFEEYRQESGIPELGLADVQFDTYRAMEQAGILHTLGAFIDGELVGFLSVLVSVVPHFGRQVATSESFFVTAKARKSGAGLRLLRAGEQLAEALDIEQFFVSAPVGSRLAEVLPRRGYRATNVVCMKTIHGGRS